MYVPEGDKQDTDTENLPKEIIAVNHLNLESEADIHQMRDPMSSKQNNTTPTHSVHTLIKLLGA